MGLLITSYAAFRSSRAAVIETFVSPWVVAGVLCLTAVVLSAPLIVTFHDGIVPAWFNAGSQLFSFGLLMVVVTYLLLMVGRVTLSQRSARCLERTAAVAVANRDWAGLGAILRRNKSSLGSLVSLETFQYLFDPQFVHAMTESGDWIHLEVLTEENLPTLGRFGASDIVGRAMLEGNRTLLQKALAPEFSAHETLLATPNERALLNKTYRNPRWYMAIRADYPLVVRAVEELQSGRLDDPYNAATWSYTTRHGVSTRWNCQVWVSSKTIYVAIKKTIEDNEVGDEYVSDLLDILRAVVERSEYDPAVWASRKGNSEYPTPFAYLLFQIVHDLGDLWTKAAEGGLFGPRTVGVAKDTPRCETLAMIWAFAVARVAGEKTAASVEFRVDLVKSFLRTTLGVRFLPFEIFHRDPDVQPPVLDSFRNLLSGSLIRAVKGDVEATGIVCLAAANLDRGKEWVQLGSPWLNAELARGLGCLPNGEVGPAPPRAQPAAAGGSPP